MSGVDPNFITHKLNVDPLFPSKKQKLRKSAKQRVEVVKEKMEKLKQASDGGEKKEWEVEILCRFY